MPVKFEDSYGTECKLYRVSRTITYFVLSEDAPEAEDLFPVGDVMECNPESIDGTSVHEFKFLNIVPREDEFKALSLYESSGEYSMTIGEFMDMRNDALSTLDGEEG